MKEGEVAYDENLATRIQVILEETSGLTEKKMFGGIGFLIQGNMACGVIQEDLIVRVGSEAYEKALNEPHVRVFDMTGRPMRGWIMVSPEGTRDQDDLQAWVLRGADFAKSLPPK